VQTCVWPSWCHCHSLSLASVKSRLVLPLWYWLTWVVLDKGPLNGCVCVLNWRCQLTQVHLYIMAIKWWLCCCCVLVCHYHYTEQPASGDNPLSRTKGFCSSRFLLMATITLGLRRRCSMVLSAPSPCFRKHHKTKISVAVWLQTHTHTHLFNGPFLGLPRRASTIKVKPIWILLKQEIVSGSGISWTIRKSAPRSRQITMPAPHHSVFFRSDALPAAQPTASKHWRHSVAIITRFIEHQQRATNPPTISLFLFSVFPGTSAQPKNFTTTNNE